MKNYFESSYISESRILFLLFYALVRNLDVIIYSNPLPTQFFLGSRGYSWNLYDADVTEFCLGASCLT